MREMAEGRQTAIESLALDACQRNGVGLYDINLMKTQHGQVLCVYVTKIGGVGIDDCTAVHRTLSILLDSHEELFRGSYTLEVSSPGIERPLKYKRHYLSAINEWVKVSMNAECGLLRESSKEKPRNDKGRQPDARKKTIEGVLKEVNDDFIMVECDGEDMQIAFQSIKKCKTIVKKSTGLQRGSSKELPRNDNDRNKEKK